MKNLFVLIILMAAMITANAQNREWNTAMQNALSTFAADSIPAQYQESANRFHQIASLSSGNWYPEYYEAFSYVLMAFKEPTPDRKDQALDKAIVVLDKLSKNQPNNNEVTTLRALYAIARLTVDPMNRHEQWGNRFSEEISKAFHENPGNPRARLLQLQMQLGVARFSGESLSPYKKQAQELLKNWPQSKQSSPFAPSWGKGQLTSLIQTIK